MSEPKLGLPHRAILLALMAEAREVSNTELKNRWNLTMTKPYRDVLKAEGLIVTDEETRPFRHELTERGWKWCADELSADIPARAGSVGAALYAVLSGVNRYLDREGLALSDLFKAETEITDLEDRIRRAYERLADRPKAWVRLKDLRPLLGNAPRDAVDEVLRQMDGTSDVTIIPDADQKNLTAEDRAAAVRIGNEDNHQMAIGRA
ncbi:hypothetical protein DMH04_15520 [Kibdelosporangium aridum]|uniref:Uncharacterized protein n=1 Tax=Kibdelosporangium aridum TaxID=2030 RepID=A0A428ZDB6_KIBAR|nr:hypothetical protein [Kibdelosporangium aridum]RSM86072.1 hypothetical protein DMH04_15520 [Kibdelosporangium aridum]